MVKVNLAAWQPSGRLHLGLGRAGAANPRIVEGGGMANEKVLTRDVPPFRVE
jgi:hypothetical protein